MEALPTCALAHVHEIDVGVCQCAVLCMKGITLSALLSPPPPPCLTPPRPSASGPCVATPHLL